MRGAYHFARLHNAGLYSGQVAIGEVLLLAVTVLLGVLLGLNLGFR